MSKKIAVGKIVSSRFHPYRKEQEMTGQLKEAISEADAGRAFQDIYEKGASI